MSEMSRPGSTPWEYILRARVTISTLPVRSPLPKSVPSPRSAPAIKARAAHAVHAAPDQFVARLGQYLDGHVLGNQLLVDEGADEIEIGLRGRGEADLDLLEAHAHEGVEEAALTLRPHGLDQRLVAVAQ